VPSLQSSVPEHATLSTVFVNGEPLRIATRRLRPVNGQETAMQISYPLADLNRATDALDRGLFALIPLGVLGAWLGATFLTQRVLGRVRRFAVAADQMGGADLSQRLPVEGNDEFADLAGTFNGLLSRVEESFARQAAALEQQRRFTADASHELKTPLTVIKGTASMALASKLNDPKAVEALTEINGATDAMVKLVQDLLYLARADSGALGRDPKELLAVEVLERAKCFVQPIPGAPIQLTCADASAAVWGNEQELVRLFTNLLSNALRHTPPTGKIVLRTSSQGENTTIEVMDNGSGISKDHLTRLGERFYRADASRSRDDGGTGLGLAIVKEIVAAHRGTFKLESELGKGTRATVTLPAAP
jgi:signal transduction histidine kinase